MLVEARKPQYLVDAYFLRYFNIFPQGVDIRTLDPIRKEFLMILAASAPSMDTLSTWVSYERDKAEALEKDYRSEVDVDDEILTVIAASKGEDYADYRRKFVAEKSEELRKKALAGVQEKYGIVETKEDRKKELMERYSDLAAQMESRTEKAIKESKPMEAFLQGPGGVNINGKPL